MGSNELAHCQVFFERLHPDRYQHCRHQVVIIERDAGGAGSIIFNANFPMLKIQTSDDRPPIHWIAQTKCADGAFILFADGDAHLHIVELKSKLTAKEWEKACLQFEGMMLSALAISGIIEMSHFDTVTCYIAYKEDAISIQANATPVGYKQLPGMERISARLAEWSTNKINLLANCSADLVRIQRDVAGNATRNL